jgi:nucleoside-diphosphate-sugar epimerase
VATQWLQAGHDVSALTRSLQRAVELRGLDVTPFVGDVLAPETLRQLRAADVLLMAVGAGSADKRAVYVDGLANVLAATAEKIRRIIYVSSVSVYGQADGSWVDESSPCEPTSAGGKICLEAESVLRDHSSVPPDVFVLRLAGIYGPVRLLTRIEELRAGTPLGGEPDAWLNLIHVDDAARAVVACSEPGRAGGTYVVCDDGPVKRREYYTALARLVGAPAPQFDPELQTGTRGSGLNKRCSNKKLRTDLGFELAFPTFEMGLPHAVDQA